MKALPNLRTSMTRRRLHSLLPSAMMGLVTFSFTLLFVGAAAYTVSLPSLMKGPEGKSFVRGFCRGGRGGGAMCGAGLSCRVCERCASGVRGSRGCGHADVA